jgi:hypothetical protein
LPDADVLGETLEFGLVKDFGIDHADKQRFDGSLAEPVGEVFDGPSRDALSGLDRTVDEGPRSSILDAKGPFSSMRRNTVRTVEYFIGLTSFSRT